MMNHSKRRVIWRTLAVSLAAVLLTVTVLAASELFFGEIPRKTYPDGIPAPQGELRALTVRTQDNADFPSAPGLPAKILQDELDELATFAKTYGYNAIFFEASPQGDAFYRSSILPSSAFWTGEQGKFTFFDPLKYLVNICKEKNIQIYAVVNPFHLAAEVSTDSPAAKNPSWVSAGRLNPAETGVQKLVGKITEELTANYDVAGVLLSGVDSEAYDAQDYAKDLANAVGYAHDAVKHKDSQRLGLVVNSGAVLPENGMRDLSALPLQNGDLDFVVPVVPASTVNDAAAYAAELSAWDLRCADSGSAAYYPLHAVDDGTAFLHVIDNGLFLERQHNADGVVVSNYGALNTEARVAAYSVAATFAQEPSAMMPDLSYPQTFAVTRPAQRLTTSYDKYFITGTSDPSQPLLYNGQEVSRSPQTGLWGLLVNVPYGTNTYSFSQGGATKTVTIVRPQPSGAVATIDSIQKSDLYPSAAEVVLDGDVLKLSCVAPAGGTVTASVGGLTQTLEPLSAASQNGIAMTYQATLDLSSVAVAGQVKKLGPITYNLNYAGMNSSQQSAGEVFVTGEGIVPVAKMKNFSPISQNGKDDGDYSTLLKKDCVVEIAENPRGGYYKLVTGDYVPKSSVDIPEGAVTAQNNVTAISLSRVPKGEKIILTGTARPYFKGELVDGKLTVTLQNITGFEKLNAKGLESQLCESIDSEIGEDQSLTLTFTLAQGVDLLGWDVQFENDDTIIYLRKKPALLKDTATPLAGVTILLDPGHGGTDPGALGIPGETGPMEKTLNLANSYALQSRFAALGAEVHVAQADETMTLNDRIQLAETLDADVFISSHHNSLGENVDSNDVSGIEVYYYNSQSESFAQAIGENLSQDTGRKLRWAQWSWYRVTMMTARPAVLIESGYICNPSEYEEIANEQAMYRYANAVADAVLAYFGD